MWIAKNTPTKSNNVALAFSKRNIAGQLEAIREAGEVSTEFETDKLVFAAFRKQYGNRLASRFGAKDFKAPRLQYIDDDLKYHTINMYCSRVTQLCRLAPEPRRFMAESKIALFRRSLTWDGNGLAIQL